jgi:hypothetical protein
VGFFWYLILAVPVSLLAAEDFILFWAGWKKMICYEYLLKTLYCFGLDGKK